MPFSADNNPSTSSDAESEHAGAGDAPSSVNLSPSDANASSATSNSPPSTSRHPSNAADEEIFPLADAGEYYIGMWNGTPKYGCPACAYNTLADRAGDGDFAVESHIQEKAKTSEKHVRLLEGRKGDNA